MSVKKQEDSPATFFEANREKEVIRTFTVKRLSIKNTITYLFEAFSLEYGVLFTLKQLFINPGKLAIDYLTAGRYKYTPPFRLLILSTALTLFSIEHSSSADQLQLGFFSSVDDKEIAEKVLQILSDYRNIWFWLYIPLITLFTWPIFRKKGFNYAENLVLHTYTYCISNFLGMLMVLDHWLPSNLLWGLNFIGLCFYYTYAYKRFFQRKWGSAVFEMVGLYLLTSIIYMLIVGAAIVFILVLKQ